MSRCKCCDTPLVGKVRYKDHEDLQGLYLEEDMCTKCIRVTAILEYTEVKTYQFEDLTESLEHLVDYEFSAK